MKIGDIVRVRWCGERKKELGVVCGIGGRFPWPWIATRDGVGCLGEPDQAWIMKLTAQQRAIVNAAIAAEALRRIDEKG